MLSPHACADLSSIQLFLAADQQLAQDRGPVRLTNVQARLCQCLWLLLRSRVNHCYSLFGTVAHMAIAIGLNRNINSVNPNRACYTSEVELESRRRTFWSMYCLDNHLSLALGRPKTFHDEDIDQELPSFLDNSDLYPSTSSPDLPQSSLIVGPVAYYTFVVPVLQYRAVLTKRAGVPVSSAQSSETCIRFVHRHHLHHIAMCLWISTLKSLTHGELRCRSSWRPPQQIRTFTLLSSSAKELF